MAVLDDMSCPRGYLNLPRTSQGCVELRAGGGRRRTNGVQRGQIEVTCKKVTQIPPNARRPSKKDLVGECVFLMANANRSLPTHVFEAI